MQLKSKQLELWSLVEYFYAISGVPAKDIKLKDLRHSRTFIQSTSQGSRCLKKGEKLLYLKEVNIINILAYNLKVMIPTIHSFSMLYAENNVEKLRVVLG